MGTASRHTRARAGYSLVEMMVALAAGAILISSAYVLLRSSSRSFHRTSRVATTQAALRLAAEQLRGDIARAGFLGHPDTEGLQECGNDMALGVGADNRVRAVALATTTAGPANNPVRRDTLTLTGNYLTSERYDMRPGVNLSTLRIDPDDPAFRRSFVSIDGTSYDEEAFSQAFAKGRLVRVEVFAPQRRTFFRVIDSSNASSPSTSSGQVGFAVAPTITLEEPLDPGGGCGLTASNLDYGFIAPLTTVEYALLDPSSESSLTTLVPGDEEAHADGSKMEHALVRRELSYEDDEFREGSERIALEFAVEFGLAALACPTVGASCSLQDLMIDTALTTEPDQIQGLRVSLAARTPEVDPGFAADGGAFDRGDASVPMSGEPLRSWRPSEAVGRGRARVRSTFFDVALINNQQ